MADFYSEAEINKRIKQLEQERKAADAAYLSQLGDINKVAIANQQKAAEEAILQTQQDYKDIYDANAVQEQITLRQIEESMANLGLSDSGLSRSQITAATLSKNNANAKYRRQEQAAINSIRQQLSDYKMKLEQGQAQTGAELSRNTADAIAQARQDEYAAGQKYRQDLAKAESEAAKSQEDRWYDLYLRHYDVENGVDSKQAASIAASLMGGYMPSGAKLIVLGNTQGSDNEGSTGNPKGQASYSAMQAVDAKVNAIKDPFEKINAIYVAYADQGIISDDMFDKLIEDNGLEGYISAWEKWRFQNERADRK